MDQFEISLLRAVEHLRLRALTIRETDNRLILTDCPTAFSTADRTAVLGEVPTWVPVLMLLVAQVMRFFGWTRGGHARRTIDSSTVGGRGDASARTIFPLSWRPGLKRLREQEGEGAEAFAHMDDIALDLIGVAANTVRAVPFLRRELDEISLIAGPANIVALPRKGQRSDGGRDFAPAEYRRPNSERAGVGAAGGPNRYRRVRGKMRGGRREEQRRDRRGDPKSRDGRHRSGVLA